MLVQFIKGAALWNFVLNFIQSRLRTITLIVLLLKSIKMVLLKID